MAYLAGRDTHISTDFAPSHVNGDGAETTSRCSSGGAQYQEDGYQGPALANSRLPTVTYRPLCPSDVQQLQQLHAALFPLNYEEVFFQKAVRGHDNIFSWCGVQRDVEGQEQIVGFITARLALLVEADALDRKLMSLASPALDGDTVVYLLTIGCLPGLQNQGIASDMLRLVEHRAREAGCRAIYLHVLAVYNASAVAFYHRHGFWEASLLKGFYNISTGRQPEASRTEYDALLFVRYVAGSPPPSSATAVVSAAISQLRSFSACLPFWPPRRSNGLFLGNASRCVALPRPAGNGMPPPYGAGSSAGPVASGGPVWLQRMFRGRTSFDAPS